MIDRLSRWARTETDKYQNDHLQGCCCCCCWAYDSSSWILFFNKSFSMIISSNRAFNIVCNCIACSMDSFDGAAMLLRFFSIRCRVVSSSSVFICKSRLNWSMICWRAWTLEVSSGISLAQAAGGDCSCCWGRLIRKRLNRRRRIEVEVIGGVGGVFASNPFKAVWDFFIFVDLFDALLVCFGSNAGSTFESRWTNDSELLLRNFDVPIGGASW